MSADAPRSGLDPRALALAIALVSAGALAYQLLLMRWLAIAHWHPFAAMIISLALLGHGASGTWLSLQLNRARQRFDVWFPACALAFAVSAAAVLPLAARLPFNGLELVWDPRQLFWLAALYVALALPFFFAAACFGLAFAKHGDRIPRLYGADLLGAGAGALLGLALMWLALPTALAIAAGFGVLAALVTMRRRRWPVSFAAAAVLLVLHTTGALEPPVNEFKGQSRVLLLPGARVIATHDSPYGRIAVVESPRVPLRHHVGLSLTNTREPAPQLGVFVDGDAMSVITRASPPERLDYLERSVAALPYVLVARPHVLVLGAAGTEVLVAKRHRARSIDVVEADPYRLQLPCREFENYAGPVCDDVRLHATSPRAFVRACLRDATQCGAGRTDGARGHDLIVLAGEDSLAGASAGVQAASEQYTLTVEAFADDLRALAHGGVLAITRYRKQPPRDELKLALTMGAALRATGVADPADQLLVLRGWDASVLVATRDALTPRQLEQARAFADANGFELDTGLPSPLAANPDAFIRDYPFAIAPATDDAPYFADFFRWRSLPELWRLRETGGAVLLDAGYLLLVAALVQAVPVALLLVVLPLWLRRRDPAPLDEPVDATRPPVARIAIYFVALGLAFLAIEIACLSRLALLVGHGLVATAVGLAGFLVFAGLGSLGTTRGTPVRAVLAIALGLAWHLGTVALLLDVAAAWPVAARAVAGLATIAPLAWAMGRPFPLGLSRLARDAPQLVPWAWALNGFASVVTALAAMLVALAAGLQATLLAALALYIAAASAWPGRRGDTSPSSLRAGTAQARASNPRN